MLQGAHHGTTAMDAAMEDLPGEPNSYRVRLADPPTAATLEALEMVETVRPAGDGSLSVGITGADEGLAHFSSVCAEQGWGLLELTPSRRSLEDLFMSVCYADPASRPDTQAA